jgi:hypothetical protein
MNRLKMGVLAALAIISLAIAGCQNDSTTSVDASMGLPGASEAIPSLAP